jgi:hypothetical protein
MLSQPPTLLGHPCGGLFGRLRALPIAAARPVGAIGVKAFRRTGTVLAIQVPLGATYPHNVQPDPIN